MRRAINIPGSFPASFPNSITASSNSIVVIGANGSGKSRFGLYIEDNNRDVHRITAQKSLIMPEDVATKSFEKAQKEFLYGGSDFPSNQTEEWLKTAGRRSYKYQNKPTTHLIHDYHTLMTLLFSDEFEVSLKFRESHKAGSPTSNKNSKLDDLISIWQSVLPNRSLLKSASSIGVVSSISFQQSQDVTTNVYQSQYKGTEMSDGERVIFYLIGEAICTLPESILVIDEPELHIHKSILKKLFDQIELARPDVLFVYLTHDIDFATSRIGSDKIWLKQMISPQQWIYQFIQKDSTIPEQVYLEILGSRKPILFIEGDKSSIDYKLYSVLFPNNTVTPLGSCQKVIDSTKAFNSSNEIHHLQAEGIIDRDRRTDSEVINIQSSNIKILSLAEVENLFLLEEVIKSLAEKMYQDSNVVFNHVKQKIISIFNEDIDKLATEYTVHTIKMKVNNCVRSATSWESLETGLKEAPSIDDYHATFSSFKSLFQDLVTNQDYLSILKYANNKKLLNRSELATMCGMYNSEDFIRSQIIETIKANNQEGVKIRQAMLAMIT